jgi:Zn-finger nucleic acid-binding protein
MKCPGCANEMATATVQLVEIDRCRSCGGVVLDKFDLAHVIEGGVVATHQHRTTTAHCHECNKDMIALRGAGDVEYDWCDSCERLFFDQGELTALAGVAND